MRILAIAIVLVMASAALTGCGKEVVSPSKANISQTRLQGTPDDSTDLSGGQNDPVPPPHNG